MKVEVVGTGCTWFTRNNTSYIIDDNILFDVSEGNYKTIIKSVDIFKLKFIIISHLHMDHASDLHIITTRYIRDKNNRTEKLRIYAPKKLAETIVAYNKLFNCAEDEADVELLKSKIDFIDIYDGMEFEEGEYKIKVLKMDHGNVESYGFMFTDKSGRVIGFSGDTKLCENLEFMLSKSKYAFVDMAAYRCENSHLSNLEFVKLSKKYNSCKMFPVHTCDACQEFAIKNKLNYLEDGQILNLD